MDHCYVINHKAMSTQFETVNIRITKYDRGLMNGGWLIGNVAKAKRAVINGHKTANVFFKARDKRASCEAAIGLNCEILDHLN